MKNRRRVFELLVLSLAIILTAGTVLLEFSGKWLSCSDVPKKSSAIVVLAGGTFLRALYGADLYSDGYAPMILISKGFKTDEEKIFERLGIEIPVYQEFVKKILTARGVPSNKIFIFKNECLSTKDEAAEVRDHFKDGVESLLIVASPYQVRRARMIFQDTFRNTKINVVGTPYEEFPAGWWKNKEAAQNVVLELSKLVFYKLGGSFSMRPSLTR